MNVETIMQNLRIVGMIREQDKLVTNPNFGLRSPSTFRAVMRRWLGENRETDLQNLRNLFGSALCVARLNDTMPIHVSRAPGAVSTDRIVEAIRVALEGLKTLTRTYHDDQEMCAKIEFLIQEVQDHISSMRPHLGGDDIGALSAPSSDRSSPSTLCRNTEQEANPRPSFPHASQ